MNRIITFIKNKFIIKIIDNLCRLSDIKNTYVSNTYVLPLPKNIQKAKNNERNQVMENERVNAADIADYILFKGNESGELITNLKLQKIIYYVQAWYLAINNKALFNEDFEAWVHGPVIPDIYRAYKLFRYNPIIKEIKKEHIDNSLRFLNPDNINLINDIIEEYITESAFKLEQMTHQDMPWRSARIGLAEDESSDNPISKESILSFYKQFCN